MEEITWKAVFGKAVKVGDQTALVTPLQKIIKDEGDMTQTYFFQVSRSGPLLHSNWQKNEATRVNYIPHELISWPFEGDWILLMMDECDSTRRKHSPALRDNRIAHGHVPSDPQTKATWLNHTLLEFVRNSNQSKTTKCLSSCSGNDKGKGYDEARCWTLVRSWDYTRFSWFLIIEEFRGWL